MPETTKREIPFTQFLRPNRQPRDMNIARPVEIADIADEVIALGGRFTAEELMTGAVSLACEYDDMDIVVELTKNGPAVLDAVDKLVRESLKEIKAAQENADDD